MSTDIDMTERIGESASVCEPRPGSLRYSLPDAEQLLKPPFVPNRWIAGGHLQSVLSLSSKGLLPLKSACRWVELTDGDRLALIDDEPQGWQPGDASLLVIHGLCGCSEAPYMLRLASRFTSQGVRVFRLNLRGCGAGVGAANQITHAGRSGDVVSALEMVAKLTQQGPLSAVGVSLGGNQLLRAAGLVGQCHEHQAGQWRERLHRIAAVSPPIDLKRCSDNMERRLMRPYNRYFIRHLLERAPEALKSNPIIESAILNMPRTMRELDERVTAPLAGYENGIDYYRRTAAQPVIQEIQVPTLILSASDDPIVPVGCFAPEVRATWPDHVRLVITRGGGHVGFIGRGEQRHWMDGLLDRWFQFQAQTGPG
jgi:predicted alpha/beta-fold hydrolase